MSTEAIMQALRRFFAKRGRSSIMYTDNGTNFVGTSRALSTLNWPEIVAECAIQKIKWNFNLLSALWYGGWWERMIRTVKQLLRKVLGRACVTYVGMETLLCECESIVNGRPLTYIYDDPNELRVIKPSGFIQEIKGNETVDLDARHLRKRIRYLQNLRFQLRQRFQRE
ncbi:integrase catalytic domain-containing protein [Trichonephila clavata]|uniref:Integrase catalytic domain-containing protein n=1 Tax=Trichonephila clavata TaxID=2740835 RepID=A0A8X6GPG4_TRICU|nr:integrase catalytic domain-containing protein [Trichonephila clavata]